jgi:drug/metabolite transporter (DMT)-like permease
MRSSHWGYLAFVFVGVGAALLITGSVTFYYSQNPSGTSQRYSSYSIPLIIVGVCFVMLGIPTFLQARAIGSHEIPLPPPPPPLPPPP